MEYGFSILMAAFSAALLLYAGLMVLFKPDLMTVPRRTIDEPKQLRMESSVFQLFIAFVVWIFRFSEQRHLPGFGYKIIVSFFPCFAESF